MALDLIGIHRPAEDDDRGVAIELRALFGVAPEVDVANAKTRLAQQRVQRAQRLVGNVLKYKNFRARHVGQPGLESTKVRVGYTVCPVRNKVFHTFALPRWAH